MNTKDIAYIKDIYYIIFKYFINHLENEYLWLMI